VIYDAAQRKRSGIIPRAASELLPPEEAAGGPRRATAVLRSIRVYDALADAVYQHVALGEREQALSAVAHAVELLEGVGDRRPFARVLVGISECLLELGCPERAQPLLEEAVAHADALPDVALGARARRSLASAVSAVSPARSRSAVEQALREVMDEELPGSHPPESIIVMRSTLRD
jgi:hypothetical protein